MAIILDREGARTAFSNERKQFFQMLSQFLNKFVPSLLQELLPFQLNQVKGTTMHITFTGSQSSLIYCWRLFRPRWLCCNHSSLAQQNWFFSGINSWVPPLQPSLLSALKNRLRNCAHTMTKLLLPCYKKIKGKTTRSLFPRYAFWLHKSIKQRKTDLKWGRKA